MTCRRGLKDGLITLGLMGFIFLLVLVLQRFFEADRVIPMLFVLGVFGVARSTKGYCWGIAASLLGVLAVNYAFMFPYYAIDLLTPINLATAIVMLIVSIMTSTLTTQISIQQEIKANAERERMRANLLRAISHDLRTPLTSIYGTCSMLLDNAENIEQQTQRKLLDDMRKDADWLIRMVENLLTVTRIDDKRMMVSKTPTVLEELIDSVLVKFRKHYPGQQVQISLPDEFVSIPMDPMLIEQVLINLLENAVIHAEGMQTLEISVSLEGKKACFRIRDDGCGIPRERLDHLFTAYLDREHSLSDGRRKGMGIGLFVCAAIIRAHGGEIAVSNLPSGGAEFCFALDMEENDEQQ